MSIAIVLGTRPEVIKMSPVIRELARRKMDFFVLHTGQHYSYRMDRAFFEQLNLPDPEYNLGVGSGSHGEETAKILVGAEAVLRKEQPNVVLVEGDTNSVLAGGLAAVKLGIDVGHVEAGLRSFDRSMPEEVNRIVTDHISSLLFAPTGGARTNLISEGVNGKWIYVTGNTIVDALYHDTPLARRVAPNVPIEGGRYAVLTLHRQENVDSRARLAEILASISDMGKSLNLAIVYPMHPRTRKRMNQFGIHLNKNIMAIEPLGYLQFLRLLLRANLVLTDSGGVQEESCVLGIPCVTIRDSTERPETLEVGSNMLAAADSRSIRSAAEQMIDKDRSWRNPFGDGKAAKRIVDVISNYV